MRKSAKIIDGRRGIQAKQTAGATAQSQKHVYRIQGAALCVWKRMSEREITRRWFRS